MKRLLFATLLVGAAACGAETAGQPRPTAPTSTTTTVATTLPGADQRALLEAARAAWSAGRPDSYRFTYDVACECDQGPWTVLIDGSLVVEAIRTDTGEPADYIPFTSVDAIFEDIERTLDEGAVPVDVEYDLVFGYPRSYIWNGPELPVDGGFILTVTGFELDPQTPDPRMQAALAEAIARWEAAGLSDYDYTFTRGCFCPEEFVGPYRAKVRAGEVTGATFNGTDLFEIDILEIGRYDEIIRTVPGVFAEVERALREADHIDVEYHPTLGHPTDVFIDWEQNAADEEVNYRIEGLRAPLPTLDTCSTSGVDIVLVPQPGLPSVVAEKRAAIFSSAMACDLEGLDALTSGPSFTASFGGGDAGALWADLELNGNPLLLDLVRHLNQAYTEFGEGGAIVGYVWPSAFLELASPAGAGLPADEYETLLELYSRDELADMFEAIGGYVGYRLAIEPDGTWIYFVAGD